MGLLLIPFCAAVTLMIAGLLDSIQVAETRFLPAPGWAMLGGFLAWLMIYFTLPRPVRTYILAHELTHALWGSLMGARISGMRISRESGSVTLSKTNFLVTLAPYFFPLYTVMTIIGYYILGIFFAVEDYHLCWLALIGFTWGFHLTFTVSTLLQRQTDIRECGHLFSYGVIYALNALGIALWIVLVSSASLEQMIQHFQSSMVAVSGAIFSRVSAVWRFFSEYAQ